MQVDDRDWRDPDGENWSDLNYGQGDPGFAEGLWWLIPVVLVVFAVAMLWSGVGFTRESIDIYGYHFCSLADNTIVCTDTGATCTAIREREQKYHDRIFGCIDPKSKNYPCPVDERMDPQQERWNNMLSMQCQTVIHRSLKCSADFQHCE